LAAANKNVWFDHVAGVGGDVVALVQTVRQCGFLDAAEWLAAHTGVKVSTWIRHDAEVNVDWETDLRSATWWKLTAEGLAEWALEILPYYDRERRVLTQLLATIRAGDAALVNEYREWRRRNSRMTAGMCHAGRLHDARVQRKLARWLKGYLDGAQA
jgi:hypothetical protein